MAAPDAAKDSTKSAAPQAMAKNNRPGGDDDDDSTSTSSVPLKQKFLPTGLSRAIVLATVIGSFTMLAVSLFGARYELVPAPNSTNGFMHHIDHLSGAVQFCGPQGCSDVPSQGTSDK